MSLKILNTIGPLLFPKRLFATIAMPLCAVALLAGCSNGLWDKYYKLGMQDLNNGRAADAESRLQLAVTQSEQLNTTDIRRAKSLIGLGECYMAQMRYSDAEQAFTKALPIAAQNKGQEEVLIENYNQLSGSLDMQKKSVAAVQAHKHALEIATRLFGKEKPETLALAENCAESLVKTESFPEAERMFKQLLPLEEKTYGAKSAKLRPLLEGYANLLSLTKRKSEAAKLISRAKSLEAKEKVANHTEEAKVAEGW